MNFRDILGSLESAAPSVGAGIGTAWGPPGSAVGYGIGSGISALSKLGRGAYDWYTGYEEPLTDEEQAQQDILQRFRERAGTGTDDIIAEARRGFQQETVPDILERIGGAGQGRSSALNLALANASQGLEGRLANLRENIERGRLGDISNYLTGQQNVGLRLQDLGQRQRESARGTLGSAMQYGLQQSQGGESRAQAPINAQQQQANITLGQQAFPVIQGPSIDSWREMMNNILNSNH